jgi:hypothetical protein
MHILMKSLSNERNYLKRQLRCRTPKNEEAYETCNCNSYSTGDRFYYLGMFGQPVVTQGRRMLCTVLFRLRPMKYPRAPITVHLHSREVPHLL